MANTFGYDNDRLMKDFVKEGQVGGYEKFDHRIGSSIVYAVFLDGKIFHRASSAEDNYFAPEGAVWEPVSQVPDDATWIGKYSESLVNI